MNLIDKQDDVAFRLGHLVDDGLQAFLKLSLVFGTSNQGTHIERIDLFVFQVLWYITSQDTVGQTLHDSGLTRTRFANQDRVVLGASAQNLQHTANLFISANHRVELAAMCCLIQVDGIFVESLVSVFRRLRVDFLSLTQFVDGAGQVFLGHTEILQQGRGTAVHFEQCHQDRL